MLHTQIGLIRKVRVSAMFAGMFLFVFSLLAVFPVANKMDDTLAANQQSETILTLSTENLNLAFGINSIDGSFSQASANVSVTTNNYTGYTLSINTSNTGEDAGKLVGANKSFNSISAATSESDFTVNADYNGLWGYKPSIIDGEANTDYLPAPTEATTIEETDSANTEANVYTIGLGARADLSYGAGAYTNAFVITGVGNPVGYTITYDKNTEDEVTNMPEDQADIVLDTGITISDMIPERSGYTFENWHEDVTDTDYQPGDTISFTQTGANDVTLKAVWQAYNTYTIVFDKNTEDDVTNMPSTQSGGTLETDVLLANETPLRTGYNFLGWCNGEVSGSSCSGLIYQPGNNISLVQTGVNNIFLKAIWFSNRFTVTYDKNTEEAVSNMPANQSGTTSGTTIVLASEVPARTDSDFFGWCDGEVSDAECAGMIYQPNVNMDLAQAGSNDINLKAVWGEGAFLDTGENINIKLKKLAGNTGIIHAGEKDYAVKIIREADSLPDDFIPSIDNTISLDTSSIPVYAWFDNTNDNGIIYVFSSNKNVFANSDSSAMFLSFNSLENVDGLSGWNTSKVIDMRSMFGETPSLANISGIKYWNTSSVTNMSSMFHGASAITNIDALVTKIHEGKNYVSWDTSNVTNMSGMFTDASSLTNIDGAVNWNTSDVTDMNGMFQNASSLTNIDGATHWDTSSVVNMQYMFRSYPVNVGSSLADISGAAGWDTSNVVNMGYMFDGASSLTSIDSIANWDTSKVTDMRQMFSSASSLTNINGAVNWDTSKVTNMSSMFSGATSLTNISGATNWDTSSVTNMNWMFSSTVSLNDVSGVTNWNTSNVISMNNMFYQTAITNIDALATGTREGNDFVSWDTSNVTNMGGMFRSAASLSNISGATNWDTSKVISMGSMFSGTAITDINALATGTRTGNNYVSWDTSSVTDMSGMFLSASSLTNINGAINWDTSKVTDMRQMFQNASSLTNINGATNWNTSKVTKMSSMFSGASSLLNISGATNWNTSRVTDMSTMFYSAASLTNIDGAINWDTSNVTDMSSMLFNCSSLTSINGATNWNTSKVTKMSNMFSQTKITNLNALATGTRTGKAYVSWSTSKVTDMMGMFSGDNSLTNISGISNWDTSNVTNMKSMFYYDLKITSLQPLNGWNVARVTYMDKIFSGIPTSVARPTWYTGS